MVQLKEITDLIERYALGFAEERLEAVIEQRRIAEQNKALHSSIGEKAAKYNLRPDIVYGVCMKESNLEPFAARYEENYKWIYEADKVKPKICSLSTEIELQKTSLGLMQVMGGVYRELGYRRWLTAVIADVDLQLEYGCRHLANKIKKYGLDKGIASFNTGSPVYGKDGQLVNASYVRDVLASAKGWANA